MHELIEKWHLNKGVLASKMGMPLGTFCNKLNPTHSSQFSDKEAIQLKKVLQELSADIDEVAGINFGDALAAVVS